ncbi:MAG: chloride channel protein [Alphaproteobacteria bacterium]
MQQNTQIGTIDNVNKNGALELERKSPRRVDQLQLLLMGLAVGIITGTGAILFRMLISLFHNLLFYGKFSTIYDANQFTAISPWGVFVILVPVVGAIGVTFLVTHFAPEAKGHGVPEVIDSVYYKSGVIRPVVALIKSLASALAIGSGSAVGREGPIIQIGSALGSTLGQIFPLTPGQRITLVAAGAGAGIAATFNTPIGGVMFAIELLLPEIGVESFLTVALSTGAATFLGRLFLGDQPAFIVQTLTPLHYSPSATFTLLLYGLLGVISGVAAAGFIHGLHWSEKLFDNIKNRYIRHAFGMLIVGTMMYCLYLAFGQYYVDGVGYATVESILQNHYHVAAFLALLFVCKFLATTISLGSGSSGGIFSPSLFLGATLGSSLGALVLTIAPMAAVDVSAFAMVGMGAVVGSTTGAVMATITMVFEMTRDYDIIMPLIIAVALGQGVRRLLSRETIYTAKLVRRGRPVPQLRHANMFLVHRAKEVMDPNFLVLPAETSLTEFLTHYEDHGKSVHVLVTNGEHIAGTVRINLALRRGMEKFHSGITLGEVIHRNYNVAREDDTMFDVIDRLTRKQAMLAIVVRRGMRPRPENVIGVVAKEHVADSVFNTVKDYR